MSPLSRRVVPLLVASLLASAVWTAAAAAKIVSPPLVTSPTTSVYNVKDDPTTGKIVAESALLKVIWGYRPLTTEYNNRSGGSIYGLFDKTTDPAAQSNLAQLYDYGTGGSSPSRAGIGGLGSTKAYIRYSSKAITEVGTKGKLLAKSVEQLANGSLVVSFTYEVRDGDGVPQYRLVKKWTAAANGTIRLDCKWRWLASTAVNDPNYNFAFSRDYGWTRLGWYTHHWGPATCAGPGSDGVANPGNHWIYDEILATEDDDDYGTYHVQMYRFDGAPSGAVVTVAMNPGAGGYDSTGLFRLGYRTWQPVVGSNAIRQITGEFSNYRTAAYGHQLRWGSWFSSDGGTNRFQPIAAGTSWTDSMTIAISH